MILTDADELREALRVALRERDEARAEASRLDDEAIYQRGLYESARAEVARLRADNADLLAHLDAAAFAVPQGLRTVAERQREACAGAAYTATSLHPEPSPRSQLREAVVGAVEATPLVTEGEP